MARNDITSAIIDGILKTLLTTGMIGAALIVPNSVQVLEKPVDKYFKRLDKKAQQRELRKVLYYMNRQGLIKTRNYEHGITITAAGRKRLESVNLALISINKPPKWDKKWRLVIFDIPEKHKVGRDSLTRKLKELGFYQLQRSVWIYPFPCRGEIKEITGIFGINNFVSYIETDHLNQQELLFKRFNNL